MQVRMVDALMRRPMMTDIGPAQMRLAAPAPNAIASAPTAHAQRLIPNIITDLTAFTASLLLLAPIFTFANLTLAHAVSARQAAVRSQSQSAAAKPAPAKVAATPAMNMPAVQNTLSQFAANAGTPFGIVVINLKDGSTANVNANNSYISASLYKLFVALAIYRGIDSGSINPGSSTGHGVDTSVNDCLNLMITVSDNSCGVALGGLVGWERQNASMHNSGFTSTFLESNDDEKTSAADVALLLKRLYDGTLLSPNSSQAFIGLLKGQQINDRLPVGLPAGTAIAHKTGDLDGYVHDAGIIYGPKNDYVLAVLSGPWDAPGNAPASFATLSSKVYNLLNP